MLRVGFVPYLNALPLNAAFRLNKINSHIEFTYAIPSQLNQMLKEKKLDIALTSSILSLEEKYPTLPDFCIGCREKILSVNLYLKETITLSSATIALTHHSATSVSLLKILCHHHWKSTPRFISLDRAQPLESYDAFLLIGDEALEKQQITGYHTIDLGKIWHEMTALPFVFALFSIGKEVEKDKIDYFSQALRESYGWGKTHFEEVIQMATSLSSLPEQNVRNYYQVCQYHFGEQEKKGLESFELFRKLSQILT